MYKLVHRNRTRKQAKALKLLAANLMTSLLLLIHKHGYPMNPKASVGVGRNSNSYVPISDRRFVRRKERKKIVKQEITRR